MGIVRFSCPVDLVAALAEASGIDVAVETGTFKGEGARLLRQVVSRVWTIEMSESLHRRAVERFGRDPGLHFVLGDSATALRRLAEEIHEPVIFWLDAHGGMTQQLSGDVFNPGGVAHQCPVLDELAGVHRFPSAAESCVLIDDARAFLGPLPQLNSSAWPSLTNIIDALRPDVERYITILDDVVIAVPPTLRPVVDRWWLSQVQDRDGRDGFEQALWEAYNPGTVAALRRLAKSVLPPRLRRAFDRYR